MTERSRPWDGTTVGDATEAPYDAATEWGRLFRALSPAGEQSANKGGVVNGASGFNDYTTTSPSANTQRVQTGLGWVQGTWHESDANVDITIPTPATSTRVDRIVLRKSWAGQTIRITRVAGTEGAGVPALTQNYGVTWDVPLYQVSITTGAVMTLTDERVFLAVPAHTHASTQQGGTLTISHTSLTNIGTNTHAQIDTAITNSVAHLAAQVGTVHGIQKFNTTGTQSMGTPSDGKLVFARANGGTLTLTTPSGAIFVGSVNSGTSFAAASYDSYTLMADGTNWYVY